jgi:hypothetical protein
MTVHSASFTSSGLTTLPTKYAADAPAAKVFNSAVPMDPPTCWLVLSVAEPTPAPWGKGRECRCMRTRPAIPFSLSPRRRTSKNRHPSVGTRHNQSGG